MDFKNIKEREVKAKKITLKLEIELSDCTRDAVELATHIEYTINANSNDPFINFVISLIKEAGASTWKLTKLETE